MDREGNDVFHLHTNSFQQNLEDGIFCGINKWLYTNSQYLLNPIQTSYTRTTLLAHHIVSWLIISAFVYNLGVTVFSGFQFFRTEKMRHRNCWHRIGAAPKRSAPKCRCTKKVGTEKAAPKWWHRNGSTEKTVTQY